MVVKFEWLLDFCRFYQGEDSTYEREEYKIFWICERAWVRDLCTFSLYNDWKDEFVNSGLNEFCFDDGVPNSLKAYIFRRAQLSPSNYKKWYVENYLKHTNINRISKGKTILNRCRLAFLEYHCDKRNTNITPEMLYMFEIANAVSEQKISGIDAVVTTGWQKRSFVSIDENIMCEALSHADKNGFRIELVKDFIQKHRSGFLTYHIEFKEIRERALRYLIQKSIPTNPFCDLFYNDAEYIGFWNNKYAYRLYNEDYLEPNLWPCKYLLIDANSIEEYEDSNYIITNNELPFCESETCESNN